MTVVNGPHNVHLYHIKLRKHYYNYKISSISCHAAARSEHPNYLSKTCFLFLTFYWLIMDRSILQCTIPSIQHFPAITNETRENIISSTYQCELMYVENFLGKKCFHVLHSILIFKFKLFKILSIQKQF